MRTALFTRLLKLIAFRPSKPPAPAHIPGSVHIFRNTDTQTEVRLASDAYALVIDRYGLRCPYHVKITHEQTNGNTLSWAELIGMPGSLRPLNVYLNPEHPVLIGDDALAILVG